MTKPCCDHFSFALSCNIRSDTFTKTTDPPMSFRSCFANVLISTIIYIENISNSLISLRSSVDNVKKIPSIYLSRTPCCTAPARPKLLTHYFGT